MGCGSFIAPECGNTSTRSLPRKVRDAMRRIHHVVLTHYIDKAKDERLQTLEACDHEQEQHKELSNATRAERNRTKLVLDGLSYFNKAWSHTPKYQRKLNERVQRRTLNRALSTLASESEKRRVGQKLPEERYIGLDMAYAYLYGELEKLTGKEEKQAENGVPVPSGEPAAGMC